MAFVSQEKKKSLAPAIKAVLKKYNMKATIGVRHHSTLVVNVKSGDLDFRAAREQELKDNLHKRHYFDALKAGQDWAISALKNEITDNMVFQINEYWIEDNWSADPKIVSFLLELKAAMEGQDFFCEDDPMTDYFHRSHYIDINIGMSYQKPYVCNKPSDDYIEDVNEVLSLWADMPIAA